jgi:hypothetical protein
MADMRPSEAMRIMENPEDYTVQERKDAKRVLKEYGPKTSKDKTGGLRVDITLPTPKPKRGKAKMMRGGMANGKEHMYAAGGMVKDNPGLMALKKASPEAYKKITGK